MIATLLLSCLVQATPPSESRIREVFNDTDFSFCHDVEFPPTDEERDWCANINDKLHKRCPRWKRICAGDRRSELTCEGRHCGRSDLSGGGSGDDGSKPSSESGSGDSGPSDNSGGGTPPVERETQRHQPSQFEMPVLGGLAKLLFWLLLIVAVVFIARAIVNALKNPSPEEAEPVAPSPTTEAVPEAVLEELGTNVDRLWSAAQTAAQNGDYSAALTLGHRALLAQLHHGGRIKFHRSRTNGDYLRDLRRDPELRRDLRPLVHSVEEVQFGGRPAGDERWRRYAEAARNLMSRVVPLLLVFGLGLSQLGCGDDPASGDLRWENSPQGTRAFKELAAPSGISVNYRQARLAELQADQADGQAPDALILLRGASPTADEWKQLLAYARGGGTLIVAHGGDVPSGVGLRPTWRRGPPTEITHGLYEVGTMQVASASTVAMDDFNTDSVLFYTGEDAYGAYIPRGTGKVIVLGDDWLFTNIGMLTADNARGVVTLLNELGVNSIQLLDGFYWMGVDSPMDVLTRSELTPFVLHGLLLLLVIALWRGVHFGRPHDARIHSRRAFSEHVEALGLQYAKIREPHHALTVYSAWALDRLGGRSGHADLARHVAASTDLDVQTVRNILSRARAAADGKGPTGEAAQTTLTALANLVADTRRIK